MRMTKIQFPSALLCLLILAVGPACRRGTESDPPAPQRRSTLTTITEGITGKQALERGRQAQNQISDIAERQQQQLNEAQEE